MFYVSLTQLSVEKCSKLLEQRSSRANKKSVFDC